MRILFITNYYPPSNYGWGYMQLCEEVADGLAARGHEIAVLTSARRDGPERARAYPVHRRLAIEPDWQSRKPAAWQFFVGRRARERRDLATLEALAASFQPDVIFVWHAIGLSRRMLQRAESLPGVPAVYYLAGYLPELPDEYLAYWQAPPVGLLARWLKRLLAPLALRTLAAEGKPIRLRYEHVLCVSDYVRRYLIDKELIVEACVIHNGVDLKQFDLSRYPRDRFDHGQLHCLVAGRVCAEKGVHTAVEALSVLRARGRASGITLTILGDGPPDYIAALRDRVRSADLTSMVTFRQPVSREEMPRVLGEYDVLLVPSEYQEPLARSMQEGMAMGLLVIGTTTGGSSELLVHERTGLAFEAGDAQSLAAQLARAAADPALCTRLAENGYRAVREEFDIRLTVERIEGYLQEMLAGAR